MPLLCSAMCVFSEFSAHVIMDGLTSLHCDVDVLILAPALVEHERQPREKLQHYEGSFRNMSDILFYLIYDSLSVIVIILCKVQCYIWHSPCRNRGEPFLHLPVRPLELPINHPAGLGFKKGLRYHAIFNKCDL